MKVLALVTDAYGAEGGIARFNRDLLGAIAAMPEVEGVDVLCRHAPRHPEPLPRKVTQDSVRGGRVAYAMRAIARAATGARYDVVLCGHLHLAPLAELAARLRRAPLWVQVYGIEAWQKPGRMRYGAMRRADLVTAISRFTRARFLEWAGAVPERVRILPCTVDDRFTPGPRPAALADRLGVAGRRIVLTVARIDRGDRYKGHEHVIDAIKRLGPRVPDLAYVIAGDGNDRPRLEQLARDRGVADRVHFAGQVRDSELLDYYRLADVFVMPSAKEGFGIVFLEAAATGLPVIAGNQDGSADPLADGVIGAMVPPGDADAIASAIEQALATPRPDPQRGRRFASAAFREHTQALLRSLAAGEMRA